MCQARSESDPTVPAEMEATTKAEEQSESDATVPPEMEATTKTEEQSESDATGPAEMKATTKAEENMHYEGGGKMLVDHDVSTCTNVSEEVYLTFPEELENDIKLRSRRGFDINLSLIGENLNCSPFKGIVVLIKSKENCKMSICKMLKRKSLHENICSVVCRVDDSIGQKFDIILQPTCKPGGVMLCEVVLQ